MSKIDKKIGFIYDLKVGLVIETTVMIVGSKGDKVMVDFRQAQGDHDKLKGSMGMASSLIVFIGNEKNLNGSTSKTSGLSQQFLIFS